jgi:HTH-type transcriptional regulator, sugar sensing transcriptional regulator
MVLEDGRIPDLMELGLTMYEARAYLALIRRESFTAAQLARAAGLPRQRIYDVLESLVRQRLAVVRPGRVASYRAIAPDLAVGRLVDERREALGRLEQVAGRLAEALAPTWSDGRTQTDPLDYVEVLRDPRVITVRFAQIQRQARSELLCFAKPPFLGLPSDNIEGLRVTRRLSRSGGSVRTVYTADILDDNDTLDVVLRFAEAGEGVRVAKDLPLKLVIADQSLVLFDMADPVAETGATTSLIIEHPALALTLRHAFTAIWEQAQPLEAALAARSRSEL